MKRERLRLGGVKYILSANQSRQYFLFGKCPQFRDCVWPHACFKLKQNEKMPLTNSSSCCFINYTRRTLLAVKLNTTRVVKVFK